MRLSLVTAAAVEPLTLAQAKQQVRRTQVDDDDAYLRQTLIPAVRERAEQATQRQLITATWDLKLDRWPCAADLPLAERGDFADGYIRVPLPPLQSVTSITYVDATGATQTWATDQYVVDKPAGPRAPRGRILLAYGASWPTARDQANAITVRFVAGYGDTDASVPPRLKMGMLLDLGTLFEHREDFVVGQGYAISEFPMGAKSVYLSFKSH